MPVSKEYMENKSHWEKIYQQKQPDELSWTQEYPEASLLAIKKLNLPYDSAIIDIGSGDSNLVDYLLEEGYRNITLLDISDAALIRAEKRLGPDKARNIKWVVSDASEFITKQKYNLWHDRATFHFLTEQKAIEKYVQKVNEAVSDYMIIGTFSENGPEKCSGLPVKRYSESDLTAVFSDNFEKLECKKHLHKTPSGASQEFLYCTFRRKN